MNAPCPAETLDRFLASREVLTLATASERGPWCAAVYYVHRRNRFYFFSGEASRHVTEALPGGARCAASVSAGGGADWREIRGAQMEGAVTRVGPGREWFGAVARFLLKFPFAKAFLKDPDIRAFRRRAGRDVHLYRFEAGRVVFTDNREGFGSAARREFRPAPDGTLSECGSETSSGRFKRKEIEVKGLSQRRQDAKK
ncbi:MAG: pyridoxamine 5'-phosphate oxidase family protein [Acidobacteria bacterium]|nr:pyridoxamine 5'-phosphate oxidase family protein [Acidobacteriota bacterium]